MSTLTCAEAHACMDLCRCGVHAVVFAVYTNFVAANYCFLSRRTRPAVWLWV